jgi:prepilin-type N-terminal cleavage/methylation domain-containing protein
MAIKSRRAAFTLIELLAVIVILAILSYFLVTNLTSATKTSEAQRTHVVMETIQIALAEYNDDKGDLPHSNFTNDQGTPPNLSNLGSECLYLAICAEKAPGDGKFDKDLGNTDEDQTPKRFPASRHKHCSSSATCGATRSRTSITATTTAPTCTSRSTARPASGSTTTSTRTRTRRRIVTTSPTAAR